MASLAIILALINLTLAQWAANTQNEDRTLDEIYQAAQKESGQLTVLWGGDGKLVSVSLARIFAISLILSTDSDSQNSSPIHNRRLSNTLSLGYP